MRSWPWCLALAAAAAAACAGERTPPARRAGEEVAVDPSTPAGRFALELWQLRPGVRLGDWTGEHPDDDLRPRRGEEGRWGEWCAAASLRTEVRGRPIERAAHFYAPEPPPDLALPDSASPDLVRGCVLGLVRSETPVADSVAGTALVDSVGTQLAKAFPQADRDSTSAFYGSAYWSGVRRSRSGEVRAVSALASPPGGARVALAVAWLPDAGIGSVTTYYAPVDSIPVDSAARMAALGEQLWDQLRTALDSAEAPARAVGARAQLRAADLATALRRWLGAAAALPPARRAAALYAADQILERAACAHGLCEGPEGAALAPFTALGARFSWSRLGGAWVYNHDWISRARALDRDSPLGQRILLYQLAHAFDFSGTCAAGAEGFRRVIAEGERYLARVPSGPVSAEVRVLVGDAWRDIVALAGGAGGIYADSSRFGAEAPEARRRALEHYRAALAAGSASPAARAAWRSAWELLGLLPPRGVRFLCVYD